MQSSLSQQLQSKSEVISSHIPELGDDGSQDTCYSQSTFTGSLGTPKMAVRMKYRSGTKDSYNFCHSTRRSTPASFSMNEPPANVSMNEPPANVSGVVLVATRPLLRALARECRPFPPWCVGFFVPEETKEELKLFASFFSATPEEINCNGFAIKVATNVINSVWPNAVMKPMSVTAAGLSPLKDVTQHFYVENSPVAPEEMESIQKLILDTANSYGAQAEFSRDYRDVACVILTVMRSGRRLTIRYGPCAANAERVAHILQTQIASNKDYLAALTLLDALLRQNKILDDTGTNRESFNGEALATMLVAIINSYCSNDAPDAGRLLMDFFLTYGFSANFDLVNHSVTIEGMLQPRSKVHRNAQMSVLDPFDETQNLTPTLDKAAHLQAVFNYCYTALSQITHVSQRQRRAQSILSTIIGGEAYWGRVLQLYNEGIQPYARIVNSKKHYLAQVL